MNSVYFDMGPSFWGICEEPGPAHLHGTGTVGILTAAIASGLRLSRLVREGLGPGWLHDAGSRLSTPRGVGWISGPPSRRRP